MSWATEFWMERRKIVGPAGFIFFGLGMESVIGLPNWAIWFGLATVCVIISLPWNRITRRITQKAKCKLKAKEIYELQVTYVNSTDQNLRWSTLVRATNIFDELDIPHPEASKKATDIHNWSAFLSLLFELMSKGDVEGARSRAKELNWE